MGMTEHERWLPTVIAAVGLLAAAVEVCGKHCYAAWKQMNGDSVQAELSAGFVTESVSAIIGTFIVDGGAYGLLQLTRRTFPSWGWPEQPDSNLHLAWPASSSCAASLSVSAG
ncbi:hypothetical protein M3650_27140 [Paenibacillus sp. MER TA 81-3]|uniref:hypothetical protein n=1 Tax=Paenibacillus sp. MER TA 81-3 TaxID=2939573 RepID=UPI00203E6780|nr:hypothetical protein [Paenibacillus sp. MER TA 81-3]MCM3342194.1 hypothetical protein [Paenibacillus sp. MER TA 81-3]